MGLLASCAGHDPATVNSEDLDVLFYGQYDFEYSLQVADLVTECARANGLSDYQEIVPSEQGITIDPAPGLEGRARAEAVGSGLVVLYQQRVDGGDQRVDGEPLEDEHGQAQDPISEQILDLGPIVTPGGTASKLGCRQWAAEQVASSEGEIARRSLRDSYADFMDQEFEQSTALAELDLRWSECMASAGFTGMSGPGDHLQLVREQINEVARGRLAVNDALSFDRAIGVANYDCFHEIEQRRTLLRDKVAERFVEEYGPIEFNSSS